MLQNRSKWHKGDRLYAKSLKNGHKSVYKYYIIYIMRSN